MFFSVLSYQKVSAKLDGFLLRVKNPGFWSTAEVWRCPTAGVLGPSKGTDGRHHVAEGGQWLYDWSPFVHFVFCSQLALFCENTFFSIIKIFRKEVSMVVHRPGPHLLVGLWTSHCQGLSRDINPTDLSLPVLQASPYLPHMPCQLLLFCIKLLFSILCNMCLESLAHALVSIPLGNAPPTLQHFRGELSRNKWKKSSLAREVQKKEIFFAHFWYQLVTGSL